MFDIGFSEILLISVLALVVLGPEKLPKVTAQLGRWVGRARGMARQFREQLEEEVNLEETRRATRSAAVTHTPPNPPPGSGTATSGAPEIASPAAATDAAPQDPALLNSHVDHWAPPAPEPTARTHDSVAPKAQGTSDPAAPSPPMSVSPVPGSVPAAPSSRAQPDTTPSGLPLPESEQAISADAPSHIHATGPSGHPVTASTDEAHSPESGQQDWVAGVTGAEKSAQADTHAAYAPSHERGT